LGSLVGGLGFVLPGTILVVIVAFLYDKYGVSNDVIESILAGIKCAVSACVLHSVYNLGRHAFFNHETKEISMLLLFIGALGAVQGVLNINFFIVLGVSGIFQVFFSYRSWIGSVAFLLLCILAFSLYVALIRFPSNTVVSAPGLTHRTEGDLFVIGLLSGLLTFGGAYTVIPFISQTLVHAWLSTRVLLDAVALTICLPAPLVTFVGFIGYNGCGIGCCILCILGVFIPAFSFTLIGHHFFEKVLTYPFFHAFFDGVTAGVIGLIFITALELINDAVYSPTSSPIDDAEFAPTRALIFMVCLGILYLWKHRLLALFVIFGGGLSGYIMFR
jgi:chromate transporter